jgi:hypothetical protein
MVSRLKQELPKAFTPGEIQQLAAKSKYYQRAGAKLDGCTFLQLVLFNSQSLMNDTLEELTEILEIEHSVDLSKQALHDRLNTFAVHFLKLAFTELLNRKVPKEPIINLRTKFNRILIKDSTVFGVSKNLHDLYPMSDKRNDAGAAVRIQFEYDVLTGTINDLSVHAFRDQDNSDWKTSNCYIQQNDLIIRDLGYMHIDAIKALTNECKADVLCRLDTRTDVYIKNENQDFVKINFSEEHGKMRTLGITSKQFDVYVGAKEHLPMRMVIFDLPDEVAAERIRKVCKERKRNGSKTIKEETIVRARLIIMITTLPSYKLCKEKCYTLYSIRWQIELLFKSWKSALNIDKTKSVKKERFECFLFSKLLQVIMIWQLFWCINKWWFSCHKKLLSMLKVTKVLMGNLGLLKCLYVANDSKPIKLKKLRIPINSLIKHCKLEIKKGEMHTLEIIASVFKLPNQFENQSNICNFNELPKQA